MTFFYSLFKKLPLLLMLFFFTTLTHAFTPEWITHQTRGRVKYTQATNIVALVYKHALAHDVDPSILFSIISVESTYNKNAISPKGARGLMQVMKRYHRDKINNRNIMDPDVNIEVGTRIYKEYLDKYKTPRRALRAYLGNHVSDTYPNKVFAVTKRYNTNPYPGSDDRVELPPIPSCCEEDQVAILAPEI